MLCSHYKINFYFLGANLPLESTLEAYDQIQPSVIISSVSRPVEDFSNNYIQDYVKTISQHIHGKGQLWLGGVHKSNISDKDNIKLFSSIRSLDQILKEMK